MLPNLRAAQTEPAMSESCLELVHCEDMDL